MNNDKVNKDTASIIALEQRPIAADPGTYVNTRSMVPRSLIWPGLDVEKLKLHHMLL